MFFFYLLVAPFLLLALLIAGVFTPAGAAVLAVSAAVAMMIWYWAKAHGGRASM